MASFEIEDRFMSSIDAMIKRTGQYKTRSEFFKDASRKRFTEIEEAEWRKKFREETDRMSKLAYSRGYKGDFPTKEHLDELAINYIKEKGIKLV